MDQAALKYVEERHKTVREAYEAYEQQYGTQRTHPKANGNANHTSTPLHDLSSNDIKGKGRKRWAWDQWDDADVCEVVNTCLDASGEALDDTNGNSTRQEILSWVEEYLEDTGSMFRLYRKSGFNVESAVHALRENLAFRIRHRRQLTWTPFNSDTATLIPTKTSKAKNGIRRRKTTQPREVSTPQPSPQPLFIRIYPPSKNDPNNRPILLISLRHLFENRPPVPGFDSNEMPKVEVFSAYERLRKYLSKHRNDAPVTPLQFVLVVDLSGGKINSAAWELIRWFTRDAADQFHGMCSSVFVVNYSWEFSAIWTFIKQMLPTSAKSRVMFPSLKDINNYFGVDSLPPSIGGTCTSPIPFELPESTAELTIVVEPSSPIVEKEIIVHHFPSDEPPIIEETKPISRTSSQNPYFGYPSIAFFYSRSRRLSNPVVRLEHARKRKRDLLRTLLWLFWSRTKERFTTSVWAIQDIISSHRTGSGVFVLILIALIILGPLRRLRLPNALRLRLGL